MRAATFGVPRVSVWRCDAAADRPSALSRLGHEPDSKLGAHGLGTKLNHRGRRVLSYEPARKFVWHLCLRSEEDFRDWAVNSRRGAVFIPRDPDVAYAGKGWVDWEVRRLTQPRVEASKRLVDNLNAIAWCTRRLTVYVSSLSSSLGFLGHARRF
jgi:hypothetical protein